MSFWNFRLNLRREGRNHVPPTRICDTILLTYHWILIGFQRICQAKNIARHSSKIKNLGQCQPLFYISFNANRNTTHIIAAYIRSPRNLTMHLFAFFKFNKHPEFSYFLIQLFLRQPIYECFRLTVRRCFSDIK